MPKYFAFIFKNYLPSCVLWSRLLFGDLTRFNEKYLARTAMNNFNIKQRNYLQDNNTNGQVEDFFHIKKNCSFKGRRNMRVDTFIAENWKDNKGLQRQFVDGLLKSDELGFSNSRSIEKLSLICGIEKSSNSNGNLPLEEDSSFDGEITLPQPVEEWNKSSPQFKRKNKKGKYLSPSQTKLSFRPVAVKTAAESHATQKLDCSSKEFKIFEQKISSEVAQRKHGFKNVKNEVKKIWKGLTNVQKKQYSFIKSGKCDNNLTKGSCEDTYTGVHCICRQNIEMGNNVKCILCQEIFHCRCVKFCPALANLLTTNYVCASCVNSHYAQFLEYVRTKEELVTAIDNNTVMEKLSNEFKLKEIYCDAKCTDIEYNKPELPDNPIHETGTLTMLQSRGMENKKSNCWLNSVLQCLFASPLRGLTIEIHEAYAGRSALLDGL